MIGLCTGRTLHSQGCEELWKASSAEAFHGKSVSYSGKAQVLLREKDRDIKNK